MVRHNHITPESEFPRTLTFMSEIDKTSSKCIKSIFARYEAFLRSVVTAYLTVSQNTAGGVLRYVKDNRSTIALAHFRKTSRVVAQARVDFDERYVWD